MRDVKSTVSNQIAIAEYRFEPRGDGFAVFVRRQLGWASLFTFAVLLVFVGLGVSFGWGFVRSMWRAWENSRAAATRPARGAPICCLPFALAFVGLWLSVPLRLMLAHWRSSMGREEWTFGAGYVTPGKNMAGEQEPLLIGGDTRAGLIRVGAASAVGISSGKEDLIVGPFRTIELAQGFERELRARRPQWFGEAAAAAFGLPEVKPAGPLEPIASWEVLAAAGGFDLVLRREGSGGKRQGTAFFIVWLCGWLMGETLVTTLLVQKAMGRTPPTSRPGREPPVVFLSIWLAFWTLGGIAAMTKLALNLTRRERWRFREGRVTAGRNWAVSSRRTLIDQGQVNGRLVRGATGWEIELVSAGIALSLGPFGEEAKARELLAEIRRRRPWWSWTTI